MQGYMKSNNASIKQNNGGNRRININLFKLNPTNESIVIACVPLSLISLQKKETHLKSKFKKLPLLSVDWR